MCVYASLDWDYESVLMTRKRERERWLVVIEIEREMNREALWGEREREGGVIERLIEGGR